MSHPDGAGRRLLVALADGSPAFRRRPYLAVGSFGRRLLIALAEVTPAFRGQAAGGGPDMATGITGRPGRGIAPPARPGPEPGRAGPVASRHEPPLLLGAVLQDRELDELLSAVRDAAPSPAHPACRASIRRAVIDLLATSEERGFTVALAITSPSGRPVRTGTPTIALEANGEYFVTAMAPDGSAAFRHVPAGEWNLRRLRGRRSPPGEDPGLALPLPRRQAELAAAGRAAGTSVVKATLPDGQARLILHRERHGDYFLEVEAGVQATAPLALAVRYGTEETGQALVVIPARRSALARLTGFSPDYPWQAAAATAAAIRAAGPDAIAFSVRAAANNATRRAWRELGDAVPELRPVIDRELAG